MASQPVGMTPEEVERIAAQLRAAHGVLELAQETAGNAAKLSLSPLTYGVQPGGLLLAPAAIVVTQVAAAKVNEAMGAVEHLISVLILEAQQQRQTSGASGAAGGRSRTKTPLPEPPVNGTPAENNRWWNSILDQQNDVIEANPDAIGNLDGIPASVRDRANRKILERMRADPNLDAETRQRVDAIVEQLDAVKEQYRPVQLVQLDFSDEGYPKMAISLGDSDTATHVSPLAFGINTGIDDIGDCMSQARALEDQKRRDLSGQGRPGESATVMWLGYDSGNAPTVHSDDLAEQGGRAFASYLNGVEAVNPNARVVPVTHSYATRMVTYALSSEGASADGLVMLGSPGVARDVRSVADLNVPPDQVYASRAAQDLVSSVIYERSSPAALFGAGGAFFLNPDPTYEGVFGVGGFGAKVFSSDNSSVLGHDLLNRGGQGYFADGSAGLIVTSKATLGMS